MVLLGGVYPNEEEVPGVKTAQGPKLVLLEGRMEPISVALILFSVSAATAFTATLRREQYDRLDRYTCDGLLIIRGAAMWYMDAFHSLMQKMCMFALV